MRLTFPPKVDKDGNPLPKIVTSPIDSLSGREKKSFERVDTAERSSIKRPLTVDYIGTSFSPKDILIGIFAALIAGMFLVIAVEKRAIDNLNIQINNRDSLIEQQQINCR